MTTLMPNYLLQLCDHLNAYWKGSAKVQVGTIYDNEDYAIPVVALEQDWQALTETNQGWILGIRIDVSVKIRYDDPTAARADCAGLVEDIPLALETFTGWGAPDEYRAEYGYVEDGGFSLYTARVTMVNRSTK